MAFESNAKVKIYIYLNSCCVSYNVNLPYMVCMCGSRGGGVIGGLDPPPEKSQNKGFSNNTSTGPDPLKNRKATKPAFRLVVI